MEKISIVGIDGSGKSSSLEILVNRYLNDEKVCVVDPSAVVYDYGVWETGHVPIGRRIAAFVDRSSLLGDRLNSRLVQGAIYSIVMGTASHPFYWALALKHRPDIMIRERDTAIDGAVYSRFYLPLGSRLTGAQRLWLITEVLQHQLPNVAVYLDVDPEVALQRILKSLEEKSWTGRKNRPHIHETLETLSLLRRTYFEVLAAAAERGTRIVTVDSTHLAPDDIAAVAYLHISRMLSNGAQNGQNYHANGNGAYPRRVLVVK